MHILLEGTRLLVCGHHSDCSGCNRRHDHHLLCRRHHHHHRHHHHYHHHTIHIKCTAHQTCCYCYTFDARSSPVVFCSCLQQTVAEVMLHRQVTTSRRTPLTSACTPWGPSASTLWKALSCLLSAFQRVEADGPGLTGFQMLLSPTAC